MASSQCKLYLDDEHRKSSCMSVGEAQAFRAWIILEWMQQNDIDMQTCSEQKRPNRQSVSLLSSRNPCDAVECLPLALVSYLNDRWTLFQGRIVTSKFLDRRHVIRSDVIHGQIRLKRTNVRVIEREKSAMSTWTNSGTEIGRASICFLFACRSWCNSRLISSTALVCCLIISAIFFCNDEMVCW